MDNERLQELVILAGDKISLVDKKWWWALIITIVASVPGYYLIKAGFVSVAMSGYDKPEIIYSAVTKQPLVISGSGIFDLGDNNYSGYLKIRNIEYEWGVPNQSYTAEFRTLGGTTVSKVESSTFFLPSSEKLIVFSRFTSDRVPEEIKATLGPTQFVRKPEVEFSFNLERVAVQNSQSGLVVSAGVKNLTPFTITQIDLPAAVYNGKNELVAVAYTNINDVRANETRTFQYPPSKALGDSGPFRAEISPEINIFDREVFDLPEGTSPF